MVRQPRPRWGVTVQTWRVQLARAWELFPRSPFLKAIKGRWGPANTRTACTDMLMKEQSKWQRGWMHFKISELVLC